MAHVILFHCMSKLQFLGTLGAQCSHKIIIFLTSPYAPQIFAKKVIENFLVDRRKEKACD